MLVFSFLTIPQIFKEEKLLNAAKNSGANQTTVLNATVSPVNVTGNSSSSGASKANAQCTVPVYNSSNKNAQDHIVDFITGQVYNRSVLKYNLSFVVNMYQSNAN